MEPMRSKAFGVVLVAAAAACLLLAWAAGPSLSLDALRAGREHWQLQAQARPAVTAAAFFLLYLAVTAASVPGALVLTLAGGAVFGLWAGTLLVSFASSLGASIAFLMSRYVLRDTVQARFAKWLDPVARGVERDGVLYLASLRLLPVVPFVAINLVMGLTRMPARRFYWVSQLATLPATLVYVNAGARLPSLRSIHDIATPRVLLSLAALALLPWTGRAVAIALGRRRVRQRAHPHVLRKDHRARSTHAV